MIRRPIVAVIGDSDVDPTDPRWIFAERLGGLLVDRGFGVQTGGRGGVMAAASRGARSAARWVAGCVIGILPGLDPAQANADVDVAIPTGLGHARNWLVVQADAVVAVGGGAGTLSELAMAWVGDRLIVARRGEGWAGKLADQRIDGRIRRPDVPEDRIFGVDTPDEALELIERYRPRYGGANPEG